MLLPGTPCVAVDPWRWRNVNEPADLLLVTHGHADHCSEDDLELASHDASLFVAPPDVAARLVRTFGDRVVAVEVGESTEQLGVHVRALPAEGPARARGFHPRGTGCAFLVETPRARFLLLGDSVALPEHENLAPDVAFVPVGGLTVTDPDEAAEGAARLGAGLAVPVHWGDLTARFDAAARFVAACKERGVAAAVGTHESAPRSR